MIYETRKWTDDLDCLYTDDPRVKDMAIRNGDMRIVASYFRRIQDRQPFAWDIIGQKATVAAVAATFSRPPSATRLAR